nr:putative epoxide hydrolase [Quercus suber]
MATVASSSTLGTPIIVHPYRMYVSQKYLDLTKRKLELTRLPRSPQGSFYDSSGGVTKDELEPLVDHWAETYDWRAQEAHYNEVLPQFRTSLNGTRLHFVHKRSASPNAIALLFVHGWPESFLSVAHIIDALCDPTSSKAEGEESVPAFHVVAPSIPGLGFSDAVTEEANNMQMTAATMDLLMRSLGYTQYIAHGSGHFMQGYTGEHIQSPASSPHILGTPMSSISSPGNSSLIGRPQTISYALADSPSGLLAYVLDAIQPSRLHNQVESPASSLSISSAQHSPVASHSSRSPAATSTLESSLSRQRSGSSHSPYGFDSIDQRSAWSPTALITWTMIPWLAGPEVALRWISNTAAIESSLWSVHSNVPLGVSEFRTIAPNDASQPTPLPWIEAYHRIAMVRQRPGSIRFAAWERPAEVVKDIRELANILFSTNIAGANVSGLDNTTLLLARNINRIIERDPNDSRSGSSASSPISSFAVGRLVPFHQSTTGTITSRDSSFIPLSARPP